ncbi:MULTISPECIES: hypothetical protein [unclassified Francisella]|uniref:hypothetical protein n=1 Tax=unclassified Francisella TaxID=2610885 RepID=UPI002E315772|nr:MULTISPECIES: hypothetical protein [unclassified Francisella]MED7818501.1 hypothetical protein [Francisella sp. 19S2-4]MED7829337.1 hypothetical protein [Francisella sp. 19S2-10]
MSKYTDISNKKFSTSSFHITNDSKKSDVDKVDDFENSYDNLSDDSSTGETGNQKPTSLTDGLQYLKVNPRWRKNTPNNSTKADSIKSLEVLSRLSYGQQEYILKEIADLYMPESADEDKQVQIPKDFTNLDEIIDKAVHSFVVKKQVAINDIEKQKSDLESQIDDLNIDRQRCSNAILMAQSTGVSESDIEYKKQQLAEINVSLQKSQRLYINLNKEQNKLKEEKESNQTRVSTTKLNLQSQIIKDLQPINAEAMAEGYVYIFLQDSNVSGFEKLALHQEYKATIKNGSTNYAEVDISEYKICDYREPSESGATTNIELPSCYAKDNETFELQKVVVLFSTVQLSAARIAKIETDTTLQTKHAQTLDVSDLKDNFDMSLSENIEFAKAKARDIKKKYKTQGATQTEWTKLQSYPILVKENIKWNLLLDNPLGVMTNNNCAIQWVQTQLSNICVNIQATGYGKSAILVANYLFNPQASGLLDVDLGGMDTDSILASYGQANLYSSDAVEKVFKSKVTAWNNRKDQLNEVDRAKQTISLDNLKYNLRSNARQLMRNLMIAFQNQGLAWVDPTDSLIECWRDVFSQGAYGYASSFEKWFDSINNLSIDPRTTDSLYDVIANRPVDKLEATYSTKTINIGADGKPIYQYINTLTGYTLTTYEYNLDYYTKTVKTYNDKLDLSDTKVTHVQKDNPNTQISDLGSFIKGKTPKGLLYITKALKPHEHNNDIISTYVADVLSQVTGKNAEDFLDGDRPEIAELLLPNQSAIDDAKGTYNPKKLALSNSVELILSQATPATIDRTQFQEAVKKYSEDYIKKGAKKIAGETNVKVYDLVQSIINGDKIPESILAIAKDEKVETAITSFINKVHIRYSNTAFTKNLLSYKPQKQKFTRMIEDSFELKNFFDAEEGKPISRMLLSDAFESNVTVAQEVSPILASAARSRNINVEERFYRGQTHYYLKEENYKSFQQDVHKETKNYLEQFKGKNLIDEKQYKDLKQNSLGSIRYKAVTGIIDSAYGTYTAINDLNEELKNLKSENSIQNTILCLGIYKQIFDIQNSCVSLINEWNNYRLNKMLKVVPCTELFGDLETNNNRKIEGMVARKAKLSELVKMHDVVSGTLGLGISTLQLMQSVRELAKNMNNNDEHIIRADMANMINAGSTTLSSAKTIADTLKGAEKAAETGAKKVKGNILEEGANAGIKVGTSATRELVETRAGITLLERLGIEAAGALSIPYLGEILLVIDIGTTLWSAWEEANKDNIYQKWIKLSNLYKD